MAVQVTPETTQVNQDVEPSIWIYGNPDKSDIGFPLPGDLTQYIKTDIFSKENGRYRYTQSKNADIIVLSRDGLAYGHFEIEAKVAPNDVDRQAYPRVKFVYLVRLSTLYNTPVPLSSLAIGKLRFGRKLTSDEFQKLQELAGGSESYHFFLALPRSTRELERILREVRVRLGQSEFRQGLIAAYNSRCAVSDCDAVEALEAAHIAPYSGADSNQQSNGLLLRADIHTLFDIGLIGIDPNAFTIALKSSLQSTSYSIYQGKSIAVPADPSARPSPGALAERWKRFTAS